MSQPEYFFSSGSYGCVHYPRIKCNGMRKSIINGKRKDGLLSKLVLYDKTAKNEYTIGQKLQLTKMLKNAPIVYVERKCEISSRIVDEITNKYKKCKLVVKKDERKKYPYCLFFSKYYQSTTCKDYLNDKFSTKKLLKYFNFTTYVINVLKNFNIVHMDMHLNNIIHDKNGLFHLIDFGLALDLDKLYIDDSKVINYVQLKTSLVKHDPSWLPLPIECHILTHYIFENRSLDENELLSIVDTYYDEMYRRHILFVNERELDEYKLNVYNFYREEFVNNQSIQKHVAQITLKASFSWDMYRVCLSCLTMLRKNEKIIEEENHMIEFRKIQNLMISCLDYNYMNRPSPEQNLKNVSKLVLKIKNNLA